MKVAAINWQSLPTPLSTRPPPPPYILLPLFLSLSWEPVLKTVSYTEGGGGTTSEESIKKWNLISNLYGKIFFPEVSKH